MNITEKILARASGKDKLEPDDVIFANVDKIMLHDVSGPGVIKTFEKLEKDGVIKVDKLFDPSMIWVTEDQFVPSVDKISAENIVKLSNFTNKFGIKKHFKYGMGQYGICHSMSHEEGLVSPGELYVGGDSHTNTTGALGAFACGLGHTDIAYAILKGRLWFKVPETLYFMLNGKLPENVMAKDLILRIIGDFTETNYQAQIKKYFKSKVDVVVSDMAVNTTGNKNVDSISTGELCKEAIFFAKDMLNKDGKFVSKIFMGSTFNEVVSVANNIFKKVSVFKPKSSRKDSKENFIICKNLR